MAIPTPVNGQITDAVAQANSATTRDPMEGAAHELFGSIISALGVASQRGLTNHQQAVVISQAAATLGLSLIYPVEATGRKVTQEDVISYLKILIENCSTE